MAVCGVHHLIKTGLHCNQPKRYLCPSFQFHLMAYRPFTRSINQAPRCIWLSLLLTIPVFTFLTAQSAPRFIKTAIADSGTQLYLPGKADPATVSYSPDSSIVYTIEVIDSTTGAYYHFGSIVAQLKGVDLTGQEEAMLLAYLDYLKTAFDIKESAGYGKGHSLTTHPTATGILDYWLDAGGTHWIVKGWAAESTIFVLFIYGPDTYPNQNIVDVFFKGARFKGD